MQPKPKNARESGTITIIASLIGLVIFFLFIKYFIWWVPNLAKVLGYIKEPLRTSLFYRVISIIIIIFLAYLLLFLKRKFLEVFGMLELVAGMWTIWLAFTKGFDNDLFYALAIGGGLFISVRGLENITHAKYRTSK